MSGEAAVVQLLSERFATPPLTPAASAADLGAGIRAEAYWAFDHRLEVVVASAAKPPREASARAAWQRRLNRRPVPLVLLISGPDGNGAATVVGPGGDPPPVVTLDPRLIGDDLAQAAQLEPLDVRRRLPLAWQRAAGASGLAGIRNRGLLSSHYLERRVPRFSEWRELAEVGRTARAAATTPKRLEALGFDAEERSENIYVLRADGRPAAAVLAFPRGRDLDRAGSAGELPVAVLLREMQAVNAEWGILAAGPLWRLHSVADPSRATSFVELDLDKLAEPGYFAALFSADALRRDGIAARVLRESHDFAVALGDRLRERVYGRVVPGIARGVVASLERQGERPESREEMAAVYAASLELLFRLLFVLYAEARDHLPVSASAGYRAHSLRQRIDGIVATVEDDGTFDDRATDIWSDLSETFHAVAEGQTEWGVPAYDGGLFKDDPETEHGRILAKVRPANAGLGPSLYELAVDTDDPATGRIDYADLDIRRLGDIYEGLLQFELDRAREPLAYDAGSDSYVPANDGATAQLQPGDVYVRTRSGGRKASGSFYTPQFIVRHLVEGALVPALDAHLEAVTRIADSGAPEEAERRLWDFKVCDPAMGSGHFLVDALDVLTDRIAAYLTLHPLPEVKGVLDSLREMVTEQERALPALAASELRDVDLLKRVVLKRCIYGVDVNPMAVELARLALWLEAFVPGLPLSYLDHNLQAGNSLIGVVGDEVLDALDDPVRPNLFGEEIRRATAEARTRAETAVAAVERRLADIEASAAASREAAELTSHVADLYDAWTAESFGATKVRERIRALTGNPEVLTRAGALREALGRSTADMIREARDRQGFFHWPLAFPEVWREGRGGFDVVLANPPWEKLKPEKHNYYALYRPGLKGIREAAERDRIMAQMDAKGSPAAVAYQAAVEDYEGRRAYFSRLGDYRLSGRGDLDLFKAFAERFLHVARRGGAIGCVLPRQLLAGAGSALLRRAYLADSTPLAIDVIENRGHWAFENVHGQFTIVLAAVGRRTPTDHDRIPVAGPIRSPKELAAAGENRIDWSLADLAQGSDTLDVPLIGDPEMGRVFAAMLHHPRFGDDIPGSWRAIPYAELHGTADRSGLFETEPLDGAWEVWKGSSFDRYTPGVGPPAFWADPEKLQARLQGKRLSSRGVWGQFPEDVVQDPGTLPILRARIAFRDVSRATDSRTMRACLVPPHTALIEMAPTLLWSRGGARDVSYVLAVFCSLPFDWLTRRRVEAHMKYALLNAFSVPREPRHERRIAQLAARLSCIDARYADFAREAGVEFGPLPPDERSDMEAEIDALVAHAYGLSENDLRVIFRDFTERAVSPAYRERVVEHYRAAT